MAEVIVKWVSDNNGYGFIEREGGKDPFVHYTAVTMQGFKTLAQRDRVSFDIKESERGLEAKNVIKLT